MPPFDHDLTDPEPDLVEARMVEAVETANRRCRVGKMDPDPVDYRRFLAAEFARQPEGVGMWLAEKGRVTTYPSSVRATLLGLAWWTSPLGQRHVRVAGRRIEPFNQARTNRFGPADAPWPALCHLEPEAVVARTFAGGKPEAVAICACGAVGTPAQLGWVGGCCGPCHDHREEHGTPLPPVEPALFRAAGPAMHVAFSGSGKTVAAAAFGASGVGGGIGTIHFWDRKTGKARKEFSHDFFMGKADLPFAAAGKRAFADGYDEGAVWDLETGRLVGTTESSRDVSFPVAHPDGFTLVGFDPGEGMVTRQMEPEDFWQPCPVALEGEGYPAALAFSPDGKTLAVGRWAGRVDLLGWPAAGKGRALSPAGGDGSLGGLQVQALAFSRDGARLAAGLGPVMSGEELDFGWDRPTSGHVLLYELQRAEPVAGFALEGAAVNAVAFSPDGTLLFAADTGGVIRVYDAVRPKEVATLSGHVGAANGLALSPDGETLASAGGEGLVRMWPWRRLLDAPRKAGKKGKK